jgi:hypothetical protein
MKSIGAIKHKLNQVRFRHLKRRLEAELRPAPGNCAYNAVLPKYHAVKGPATEHPSVGVCMLEARQAKAHVVSYCDDRVDGGKRAAECKSFCPRLAKEDIKVDFQQKLEAMTLPEVAYHYPDMAALIWVLDASDLSSPDEPVADPPDDEPKTQEEAPLPEEAAPSLPVESGESPATIEEPVPVVVQEEEEAPVVQPAKPWYARLLGVR